MNMTKNVCKLSFMALFLGITMCFETSCKSGVDAPEIGTLTAYYAKEDFKTDGGDYQKGQLICDSNNPIDRIVDLDEDNYMFEGDDTGVEYSWNLPKSKVEKKTFTMNELTANNIGDNAYFVSESGYVAHIFWSYTNGHCFCSSDGKEVNRMATKSLNECYVLSVEKDMLDGNKYIFEEQLDENRGSLNIYVENPCYGGTKDSNNCRYREGFIGLVEENWYNADGWDERKSAYSEDGKLMVDQWEVDGYTNYMSVAYIADLDALYIEGELYYRTNDLNNISTSITEHSVAEAPQVEENNNDPFVGRVYDGSGNGGGLYTEMTISFDENYKCTCSSDWYRAYSEKKALQGSYEVKGEQLIVRCKDGDIDYEFVFDIKRDGKVIEFDHSDPEIGGTMGNDFMSLELRQELKDTSKKELEKYHLKGTKDGFMDIDNIDMILTVYPEDAKGVSQVECTLHILSGEGNAEGTNTLKGTLNGQKMVLSQEDDNGAVSYEGIFDGKSYHGEYSVMGVKVYGGEFSLSIR